LKNELTQTKEQIIELQRNKDLLEERTVRAESDLLKEQQEV